MKRITKLRLQLFITFILAIVFLFFQSNRITPLNKVNAFLNYKTSTKENLKTGVIALNLNKNEYSLNKKVGIEMTSLDNNGHTLCNADLKLKIITPENKFIYYSTKTNSIVKAKTCGSTKITDNADYFVNFYPSELGTYYIYLTSDLKNQSQTIQ